MGSFANNWIYANLNTTRETQECLLKKRNIMCARYLGNSQGSFLSGFPFDAN